MYWTFFSPFVCLRRDIDWEKKTGELPASDALFKMNLQPGQSRAEARNWQPNAGLPDN